MFTGLIADLGSVSGLERDEQGATLRIESRARTASCAEGDSIAVNGVCLTATELDVAGFTRAGDARDARALLARRPCSRARA